MKASELKTKSEQELRDELLSLLREQFTLRMQKAMGEQPRSHQFKVVRKNIARVKTVMIQKKKGVQ